jgi:hypothetical protein
MSTSIIGLQMSVDGAHDCVRPTYGSLPSRIYTHKIRFTHLYSSFNMYSAPCTYPLFSSNAHDRVIFNLAPSFSSESTKSSTQVGDYPSHLTRQLAKSPIPAYLLSSRYILPHSSHSHDTKPVCHVSPGRC